MVVILFTLGCNPIDWLFIPSFDNMSEPADCRQEVLQNDSCYNNYFLIKIISYKKIPADA